MSSVNTKFFKGKKITTSFYLQSIIFSQNIEVLCKYNRMKNKFYLKSFGADSIVEIFRNKGIYMDKHPDIQEILISRETLNEKVQDLARKISEDYRCCDLVLVSILKGGLIFLADLSRALSIDHAFDMVGAMSYGSSMSSSGNVIITKDIDIEVSGKDVLLIEDIYDTGRTLKAVKDLIALHSPRSVEVCVLINKEKQNRPAEVPLKYVGFTIPDVFVVGYGLDYAEKYRNLDFIGILKESVYS